MKKLKLKFDIRTFGVQIPEGTDRKALDKKVKLWADRRVYGIEWDCFNSGTALKVTVWLHTGNAREKWHKDFKILQRIVANSAPKPEPPPYKAPEPRKWFKRLRGHQYEQDPAIYYLETPAHLLGDVRFTARFEVCRHYNGSGRKAFGGHDSWPVLKLEIPFKPGEEARRDEVILKLQRVIDEELDRV